MTFHALIRGFKRSGKDTFAKALSDGNLSNYAIYKIPGLRSVLSFSLFKDAPIDHFADPLKIDVVQNIISKYLLSIIEDIKDTNTIVLPKTIREYLIDRALEQRNINPYVYASKIYKRNKSDAIIADHRYKEEHNVYFENNDQTKGIKTVTPITFLVWNSKVEEPSLSQISEHQLDDVIPDYIVLQNYSGNELDSELLSLSNFIQRKKWEINTKDMIRIM